jgi:hypothetical protein
MDKAIAALIGAGVSIAVLLGTDVPEGMKEPAMVSSISAVAAGVLTWLVPNKS